MQPTNTVAELPIDATGEVARYTIDAGSFRRTQTVSVHIDGTDTASYRVEFGEEDSDGTIRWFTVDGDFEYSSVASVSDSWQQSEAYIRLMVTTAATTSGATADVAVSRGR